MTNYNLSALFEESFGVSGIKNYPGDYKVTGFDFASRQSELGTPVIFPLTFEGGQYNYYDDFGEIKTKNLGDFNLPDTTLVDCRRAKIIKETIIPGNRGSVTEMYGFSPWALSIRGFLLDGEESAFEQHKKLLIWESLADGINVLSEILESKDIFRIIIKEIEFRQIPGKPGVIPFTMNAKSDSIIDF